MPNTCGLWGSSAVSQRAWCLRCTATHWRVTMPVVSQSQKRKKWATTGCSSSARCDWLRCRKMVTAAMVTWVRSTVRRCTPEREVEQSVWVHAYRFLEETATPAR